MLHGQSVGLYLLAAYCKFLGEELVSCKNFWPELFPNPFEYIKKYVQNKQTNCQEKKSKFYKFI